MAEFYLQTHLFLDFKWKELMDSAYEKENLCISKCNLNEVCEERCKRPALELSSLAREKQELYVKKGVEYCKSECWDAVDLPKCCKRCVGEYSVVINDFKNSLIDQYKSTSFYNT